MSLKNIVRDLREKNKYKGIIGRRGRRSHIAPEGSSLSNENVDDSIWADLPPELLLDIVQRLESDQTLWPARRDVVACASVCRSWREMTKELVKVPELSGLLTFPSSLKQPGPRDAPIQCFIKRERATGIYRLYLGLSPDPCGDKSKLLLSAKRVRRATGAEFVISFSGKDFSRNSSNYIGKLRSNFLGTKFTLYENQPRLLNNQKVPPSMQVPPSSSTYSITSILYELNVLRNRGPRRMQCTMYSIPNSFQSKDKKKKKPLIDFCSGNMEGEESVLKEPIIMKNRSPRWHEQLQCWCLNFKGRVTVASVKNFQLVAVAGETGKIPEEEEQEERVILQFGKIGKDIFTMDYSYPMSAFQAFAICLSSFDTKPVCE